LFDERELDTDLLFIYLKKTRTLDVKETEDGDAFHLFYKSPPLPFILLAEKFVGE
jgi:hypothetical protein